MQLSLPKDLYMPDYEAEKGIYTLTITHYIAKCVEFITSYTDASLPEDPIHGKHKYLIKMQRVANKEEQVINIELTDVQEYFNTARDSAFVDRIRVNT